MQSTAYGCSRWQFARDTSAASGAFNMHGSRCMGPARQATLPPFMDHPQCHACRKPHLLAKRSAAEGRPSPPASSWVSSAEWQPPVLTPAYVGPLAKTPEPGPRSSTSAGPSPAPFATLLPQLHGMHEHATSRGTGSPPRWRPRPAILSLAPAGGPATAVSTHHTSKTPHILLNPLAVLSQQQAKLQLYSR